MLSVGGLSAADLSQYREFRLGMDLQSVARLVKSEPSQAKVLHRKPALLQEMEWRPQFLSANSSQSDPVRAGVFSFYDGALYRALITYNEAKTEGLTPEDLTAALAAVYGPATPAAAAIMVASEGIQENASVLAQWGCRQFIAAHSHFVPGAHRAAVNREAAREHGRAGYIGSQPHGPAGSAATRCGPAKTAG